MLIKEIYRPKTITIKPTALVSEAMTIMAQHKINGLIVTNDKNKVVGILSIQDIAGATVPKQFRTNPALAAAMYRKGFFHEQVHILTTMTVKKVMRRDFVTVSFDSNIMEIMADFLFGDLYIVPVVVKNELVGIVTRSEIKQALYGALFAAH